VRLGGALGSENAGMSSDSLGENPRCRKLKVSSSMSIRRGLVGTKGVLIGTSDVQAVNILLPKKKRYYLISNEVC
jgi:hypothetical protein